MIAGRENVCSRFAVLGWVVLAACVAGLLIPGAAAASRTPLRVDLPPTPEGYEISAEEALEIADMDPNVIAEGEARGRLTAAVGTENPKRWEVGYFDSDEKVVLVIIDGVSGEIAESWTGDAVAWPMARGREGQFGHILNAPYVWIPMAAVFFLALLDWRRPLRIGHLDLLVLLSFGVSHAFFNAAEIGVSVPLYYPPLLYLLARMLWIGFRGARAGDGLRPSASLRVLIVLCIALAIFRVTINIADSGVIDVGYAGVIGADKISDAEGIYGEGSFPENNPRGDTYGPANYFAYVPFEQVFNWSGAWDSLKAARAAALFFDLLALAGLVVLGLRMAGRRLAATLALAWLAYPYSAFVLQSNSNDSLLAAGLIWSLVVFAAPLARGATLAVTSLTKFAPAVLAPLYLAGRRGLVGSPLRPRLREFGLYIAGFAAAAALLLAHPAIDPGLATFWERTIGSQAGRTSPFSIWGQVDLELLHTVVKAAVVGLAVAVAFVPRRRDLRQIAALGASLMIAVELIAEHWFYLYIVWFLPLLLVALCLRAEATEDGPADSIAAHE